jgi:hypothetical protein
MDKIEIGDVLAGSSQGSKSMSFITNELFNIAANLVGDPAKSLEDEYLNLQTVNAARSENDQLIDDSLEIEVSFQNDLIEILTEHLELPPFTFIDTRDGEHIVSVDYDEIDQLFAFDSCPSHKVIDPQQVINDINAYTDEDNFEDFITVISDHGNLTLYSWDGTEYREVWSIV